MAAITNSAFELRVSNHMFDTTKNITGRFQNSTPADELCAAGFLVVPGDKLPNEGYSGVYNENAYIMGAAGTATADALYACNTFNVQELTDAFGNAYKVGSNILGLPIPAGQNGTYTRLDEGDICRFGIGNFTTAISTNGMVEELLCKFALDIPVEEAHALVQSGNINRAKEILAYELTKLVHGTSPLKAAASSRRARMPGSTMWT